MTYEVNEMKIPSQARKRVRKTKYLVSPQEKIRTSPKQPATLLSRRDISRKLQSHTEIVHPHAEFEDNTQVVKVGKENETSIIANKLNGRKVKVAKN